MSIPSTLISGFIGLASCGYMGARILHSLWLIEVDPHRGGSISLRPFVGSCTSILRLIPISIQPSKIASLLSVGEGRCHGIRPRILSVRADRTRVALCHAPLCLAQRMWGRSAQNCRAAQDNSHTLPSAKTLCWSYPQALLRGV